MRETNHFKAFILCSCDVTADVEHLHIKNSLRILSRYLYIITDDLDMELQFIFVLPSMPGGSHPRDGVTPTHVGVHYALQVDCMICLLKT
jgi:hypothetical protein